MSFSDRFLSRAVALSAIAAAVCLVGHFVVSPPPASFTSASQMEAFAARHSALLTAAWLDGVGSTFLIVTLLGILELAGERATLAGRIVLLAGAAVVAQSLFTDTLLIASAQMSAAGATAAAVTIVQLAHAADYAFPIVNVFWATAIGVAVLRSRVLPRGFGYVAIAFGAVELVGGLAELYSDAAYSAINPFFLVMVAWGIAAGAVLALRSPRAAVSERRGELGAARA